MSPKFQFRGLVSRWGSSVFLVASLFVLLNASETGAQTNCAADEFSENIDALLTEVEGPEFPSTSNLDSWSGRRGDIQLGFAEILKLAPNDEARRKATIEALLAAESLSTDSIESARLVGRTRGETRAWTRRVLAGYFSMGVTPEDRKLKSDFITELKKSWDDGQAEHPLKNLPLYEEKATALRDLATFHQSASCDMKP